jgi:hypothetical protein
MVKKLKQPLLPFLIPLGLFAWFIERWVVPFSNSVPLQLPFGQPFRYAFLPCYFISLLIVLLLLSVHKLLQKQDVQLAIYLCKRSGMSEKFAQQFRLSLNPFFHIVS